MEQSPPGESNTHSGSQANPRLLCNPKIFLPSSLVCILNQMNLFHKFLPYILTAVSNIIFLFMPRSTEWTIHFRFSNVLTQFLMYCPVFSPCISDYCSRHLLMYVGTICHTKKFVIFHVLSFDRLWRNLGHCSQTQREHNTISFNRDHY
jgi:hypothetical protein